MKFSFWNSYQTEMRHSHNMLIVYIHKIFILLVSCLDFTWAQASRSRSTPPETPISCTEVQARPPNRSLTNMDPRNSRDWVMYLHACYPHGRPGLSSGLLLSPGTALAVMGIWRVYKQLEDLSVSVSLSYLFGNISNNTKMNHKHLRKLPEILMRRWFFLVEWQTIV